jgi:hypothetical protein
MQNDISASGCSESVSPKVLLTDTNLLTAALLFPCSPQGRVSNPCSIRVRATAAVALFQVSTKGGPTSFVDQEGHKARGFLGLDHLTSGRGSRCQEGN